RANPARVVRARRVVGEVEVEHELPVLLAEIGALDGVEQIAARSIGLAAARRVGKAEIEAAPVAVEPVKVERVLLREREPHSREARERVWMRTRGCDLPRRALRRVDCA